MEKNFGFVGVVVLAALIIPIVGMLMMFIHILFGCLMGHAAEWAFGDTLRPALKGMFGWDLPLSYIGAAFGFIYSWISLGVLAGRSSVESK